MFFRNLIIFRFSAGVTDALKALVHGTEVGNLQNWLAQLAAKPVGPMEMRSRGWVPPMGGESGALFHHVGDAVWLTLGGDDKVLPAAAVNRELQQRAAKIEETEGRKLGSKARKRLKEDVIADLLPRALIKPYRLNAYIDLGRCFIAVDTTSRKAAEDLVSELRRTLGSFPAIPLNAGVSPRAVLTAKLVDGEEFITRRTGLGMVQVIGTLSIGDECDLKDGLDNGAVVKCQRQELMGEEVVKHLEAGKQCTRLGLTLDDRVSFVFGEDLVVRKLRFLDGAVESLEKTERESLAAELDARFALMSGEVGLLFDVLGTAFKFSTAGGEA